MHFSLPVKSSAGGQLNPWLSQTGYCPPKPPARARIFEVSAPFLWRDFNNAAGISCSNLDFGSLNPTIANIKAPGKINRSRHLPKIERSRDSQSSHTEDHRPPTFESDH
jgi:hypothetical protein